METIEICKHIRECLTTVGDLNRTYDITVLLYDKIIVVIYITTHLRNNHFKQRLKYNYTNEACTVAITASKFIILIFM